MVKISLLMPTRGRPRLVNRFLNYLIKNTKVLSNIEVVFYFDEDDESRHDIDHSNLKIVKIIGHGQSMGGYNSACLKSASGQIIFLVNDDMVIQSFGWDEKILEAHSQFPDGIYLAYGNDLIKKGTLATFPILSKKTCDLLIDPFPQEYQGSLIDAHIFDIFKRLEKLGHRRIMYIDSVIFEHMHYKVGKADMDSTYLRRKKFVDDNYFMSIFYFRQKLANRLSDFIEHKSLKLTHLEIPKNKMNFSLWALFDYCRIFLVDYGLVFSRKVYLLVWFSGRLIVGKCQRLLSKCKS